jgi:hypothetical protein
MRLHKTAINFAAFVVLTGWLVSTGSAQTTARAQGFSDAGKAAL